MSNLKTNNLKTICIINIIILITQIKEYYFKKHKTDKLPDDLDEYCECILSYLVSSGAIGNFWYVYIPEELEYHVNKLIEYATSINIKFDKNILN